MTRHVTRLGFALWCLTVMNSRAWSDTAALEEEIRSRTAAVEEKLIAWRRDIHQHPELGDQEHRTASLVAEHLKGLGLDVRTKVGRTGVVAILKGGKHGPTIALRADMDALPVEEPPGLPFASQARSRYHGTDVAVMHACGHDAHTAMLMAAAEVLAEMKERLPGTVMFIFQPAEEGSSLYLPSEGKSWGAKLMLEEGLFKEQKPAAIFAMHVMPGPLGQVSFRAGATTASSDTLNITIRGKQGHGGMPWNTVDPITTAALTVSALQTVVSRQANLTRSPLVVTIGTIHGGMGPNIVPERVEMTGTLRAFDQQIREQSHADIKTAVNGIAQSAGAEAQVAILPNYETTVNDSDLTKRMAPVIARAADGKVAKAPLAGASEDFSFFAQEVPGLYVFLGVTPADENPVEAAPNHNPRFFVDESALAIGTRTMATMALNFLDGGDQAHRTVAPTE